MTSAKRMNGDSMTFKDLVKSKGYTAQMLAERTGISVRTIWSYYSGARSIKKCQADWFMMLADILDVSPADLISLDD